VFIDGYPDKTPLKERHVENRHMTFVSNFQLDLLIIWSVFTHCWTQD